MSKIFGGTLTASTVARAIGAGRVVIASMLLAAPVGALRVVGVDSATAKRVSFLTRMAAARDLALGVGTLAGVGGAASAPWLLAGAASDAVDAVVIAGAVRQGTARGAPAVAVAAGGALTAVAGFCAARELVR